MGYLPSTAHLLAFVAKEEGIFDEEGLNVELIQFSNGQELVAGLEGDKLDVALMSTVPSITSQAQGHDVTIFGGAMTNGHGYIIKPELVEGLSDDEIDVSILKGKNVATCKNGIEDLELQLLLADAGIEIGEGEDQVNLIYFDNQQGVISALQNKTIDAASVFSPYASWAENQGYRIVYRCSEEELLKNQPCCRQTALTSALEAYPNSYNAFERAMIKAYKFSQENEEETIKDIKTYVDVDESQIRTEVYGGYAESNPDPDIQATVAMKESMLSVGYLDEDYDIEPFLNTSIYENALNSIIEENPNDEIYASMLEYFEQYE